MASVMLTCVTGPRLGLSALGAPKTPLHLRPRDPLHAAVALQPTFDVPTAHRITRSAPPADRRSMTRPAVPGASGQHRHANSLALDVVVLRNTQARGFVQQQRAGIRRTDTLAHDSQCVAATEAQSGVWLESVTSQGAAFVLPMPIWPCYLPAVHLDYCYCETSG